MILGNIRCSIQGGRGTHTTSLACSIVTAAAAVAAVADVARAARACHSRLHGTGLGDRHVVHAPATKLRSLQDARRLRALFTTIWYTDEHSYYLKPWGSSISRRIRNELYGCVAGTHVQHCASMKITSRSVRLVKQFGPDLGRSHEHAVPSLPSR